MTHEDIYLWFMQLEDVFVVQGIVAQVTKFAALTTLLTEEEALVVRDLTMLGDVRPSDVFNEAKLKFGQRYRLTVDQRINGALAMGGIDTDEKPSQWIARFRHTGGDWNREDIERWALMRRLPPSLRTTLELPTPQLSMDALLVKADSLYATLPSTSVSVIDEVPELTAVVYACDGPATNASLVNLAGKGSVWKQKFGNASGGRGKAGKQCWYHVKFGDDAHFCSGPPCPRHSSQLSKIRKSSGNFKGSQ